MPLVCIDTLEGYTADQMAALGDGVHEALVEASGSPAPVHPDGRDRKPPTRKSCRDAPRAAAYGQSTKQVLL